METEVEQSTAKMWRTWGNFMPRLSGGHLIKKHRQKSKLLNFLRSKPIDAFVAFVAANL
jgi:hypothetical protein